MIVFWGQAQTPLDSLRNLVAKKGTEKDRLTYLIDLASEQLDYDLIVADSLTQDALKLSDKVNSPALQGWANTYRGLYFVLTGRLQEASVYLNRGLNFGIQTNDPSIQTYALTQLGNLYRDKGEFDSALQYYRKAEQHIAQKPNSNRLATLRRGMGNYYLIIEQPEEAYKCFAELVKLREQSKNKKLIADSWIMLGNYYRQIFEFEKAEEYYDKAYNLDRNDPVVKYEYLENVAEIYFRQGDFNKALDNWSLVLNYQRRLQEKYALAHLLFRMGEGFEEQGYYALAINYLSEALSISNRAPYYFLKAHVFYELAWVYYRNGNISMASENVNSAREQFTKMNDKLSLAGCDNVKGLILVKQKKYDSALFYYNRSFKVREMLGNPVGISASFFNLGDLYIDKAEWGTAVEYFKKGLKIDSSLGDKYGVGLNYNRLGKAYIYLAKYDSSEFYLKESLKLAIPASSSDLIRVNYKDLADLYNKKGDLKQSIVYYEQYIDLQDSLFNKQTAQSLASFKTLFDLETKDQTINVLSKDNELRKVQLQRQKIITYAIFSGALLLSLLALSFYRFNSRLKKLNFTILEKNEEIQAQSEELTEANRVLSNLNVELSERREEISEQAEELKITNQTIAKINEGLEDIVEKRTSELKQAYKELDTFFYRSSHDFRRPLTTFMGLAEVAKITVKDSIALELFDKVNETARNLDKMLMKLQSISDLGSQQLIYKEVFFKEIIESIIDQFRVEIHEREVKIHTQIDDKVSFFSYPALIKIVIENLIENSVSFMRSHNAQIQIHIASDDNGVIMTVEDNGGGIDSEYIDRVFDMYFRANEHSKGNGLGLYIVKKVVEKLDGTIELSSILGKGTVVKVFLPDQTQRV